MLREGPARRARGCYALLACIAAILAAACGVSTAADGTHTAPGDHPSAHRATTGNGPSAASGAGGFMYTGRTDEGGIPCATPATAARLPPIIYRPPSLAAGQRVPLLVALHSFGGTPAAMEGLTHFEHLADEHGFVVAYLASCNLAHPWGPADDLAYVNSEIDQISAQDNIDPSRIYVTGYSAGGYETWNAGCRLSGKVAAIAVVSNAMNGALFQTCALTKPVSQLLMVGTADGTRWTGIPGQLPNPFQTTARWRALDGCAAQPIRTQVVLTVTQETWSSCTDGSAVALYIVRGAEHVWPPYGVGAPTGYSASEAVWAFLSAHRAAPLSFSSAEAELLALQVKRAGRRRTVISSFRLAEPLTVSETLGPRRPRPLRHSFTLVPGSLVQATLSLPSSVSAGTYALVVTLRDPYGRTLTFTRNVHVPRGS